MAGDAATAADARAVISRRPAASRWLVTIALTFGGLMGSLDISIVNVAMPRIQATYAVPVTQVTWISTGYQIALLLVMPLTAWVSSVVGRKNFYQFGLIVFTLASVLAGFATSLPVLVLARMLQGIGAGALIPVQQAILRETFPLREQGLAMALYGLVIMAGPAVGPALGGWITDNFGWHWIFFINLPIGIFALLMVAEFVPEPAHIRGGGPRRFDPVGISLMAIGLSSFLLVLEQGNRMLWLESPEVWFFGILAVGCLVFFVLWELFCAPQPAVDLRILKDRSFAAGCFMGSMLGAGSFGTIFLLPLFLQQQLGYTALQSGLTIMPRSLILVLTIPFSGLAYNRLGPHVLVGVGLILNSFSMLLLSRITSQSGPAQILIPQVISGLGLACQFVSLSTAALSGIGRKQMTAATGLNSLVRQMGGALGTAIFATLLERGISLNLASLAVHANAFAPAYGAAQDALRSMAEAAGADPFTAGSQAQALLNRTISREAAVLAFQKIFRMAAVLLLMPLFLLPFLRKDGRTNRGEEAHG
ncbi:MAG: DHA2 family efflux MFS transporter permease subunit [Armatimonadetes bacterium]|nr:DHA2 family efflux MFS transporter permease subunit [Armatimonadota bacterium]